jgi:regulator of cell morphogenesis and NO signaling
MHVTEQKHVAEIVAEMPAAARLFERYKIDYCCGGRRPVGEACAEKGVSLDEIRAGLEAIAAPADDSRDWSRATLGQLISHILAKHHSFLEEELPRLDQLLTKIVNKRYHQLAPALEIFLGLKAELDQHLLKEETILFPRIRRLEEAPGMVRDAIRRMEMEHDSAGNALRQLRAATNHYEVPEGVCNTYRAVMASLEELEADLHMHIHLENNVLFPRAAVLENPGTVGTDGTFPGF